MNLVRLYSRLGGRRSIGLLCLLLVLGWRLAVGWRLAHTSALILEQTGRVLPLEHGQLLVLRQGDPDVAAVGVLGNGV